jgi:hypothetical protein
MTAPAVAALAEHAAEIRRLGKRVVADVIEIGDRLTQCKKLAGHGKWLPWLEREFGWTEMTATRFINVYDMSKSNNLLDLELPISGLYLLAAPSTPESARDEIIERAQAGETIPVAEVKRVVKATKDEQSTKQPRNRVRATKNSAIEGPQNRDPQNHGSPRDIGAASFDDHAVIEQLRDAKRQLENTVSELRGEIAELQKTSGDPMSVSAFDAAIPPTTAPLDMSPADDGLDRTKQAAAS